LGPSRPTTMSLPRRVRSSVPKLDKKPVETAVDRA
jgi:hypothetical protein